MENNIEKSFPFDAEPVNGEYDREYVADDFARYFRAFISSGVFMEEKTNLQILANDDMTVTLRPGKMMIDGYRYEAVKDIIIPVSPADGLLNRIDRIAITWSRKDRDIHYTIREGDFSYEPAAPECRRSAEYKDYVVADIYVAANKISITQSAITDQRLNSNVCGLAAPFMNIDTKLIFNQLQAFYEETVEANSIWADQEKEKIKEWFDLIRDQLTEDAAVNLQNQLGNPDFDDTGEVEGIGSFTDFMTSFVKGTTVFQLFSNLKAGLKYVLHKGQLVNNGLCTIPGMYPLDAAYGNNLQEQINKLNTGMENAGLQQLEVLPIANSADFVYTATKRCDIYVTVIVEAGNSQGSYLINGITVASIGYAWTATNPARHMLPAYFALEKGDVFRFWGKDNTAVQNVVVRY